MKTIILAIAIMLCSTSVMARSHHYDRDRYDGYNRHHHNRAAIVISPGGIYYGKSYKHKHKYKRCWERHGRTYCKYYYRDRRY